MDPLGVIDDARARAGETLELAARYLDPSLVEMLRILGFDKPYRSASGSYVYDEGGRAYLDMHSGEGFASLGHANPDVRAVLQATLDSDLVDHEQGAVAAAQLLRRLEIAGRWKRHQPTLDRLDDECGDIL